jgi:CheY-like chemotaxis protein
MSTKINALFVDDEPGSAEVFKERLELELEGFGLSIKWTDARDPVGARRKLQRSDETFDAVFVDLFLDADTEEMGGRDVAKAARDLFPDSYIVVFTGKSEKYPGFRDAVADFANVAIDRDELLDRGSQKWSFPVLASDLRHHLVFQGRIPVEMKIVDANVGILALLEKVAEALGPGKERLHAESALACLTFDCLGDEIGDDSRLSLSYMAPGRSGADVCLLEADANDGGKQTFVLKLSVERRALEREQEGSKRLHKALQPDALMPQVGKVAGSSFGYYGMAFRFADRAVTLRSWLTSKEADHEQSQKMAEVLFGRHLKRLFTHGDTSNALLQEWVPLTNLQKLRLSDIIDKYEPILADARAAGDFSADDFIGELREFIRSDTLPGADGKLAVQTPLVRAFGDLHSGNVLVHQSDVPSPVLIDAAATRLAHWSCDASRLLTDLALRVKAPGDAVFWEAADDTVAALTRLCPKCESWVANDDPVDVFIGQCLSNVSRFTNASDLRILAGDWHWQWHLALAKELMRQVAYVEVPAPRVAAGLAGSARHLRQAGTLFAALEFGVGSISPRE